MSRITAMRAIVKVRGLPPPALRLPSPMAPEKVGREGRLSALASLRGVRVRYVYVYEAIQFK